MYLVRPPARRGRNSLPDHTREEMKMGVGPEVRALTVLVVALAVPLTVALVGRVIGV
jgi:hypothetical protein